MTRRIHCRARRAATFAGLALAMQACIWTSPPPQTVILQSVRGQEAFVGFGRFQSRGELLALNDTALVLLSAMSAPVVIAPLALVQRIEFGAYTTYYIRNGALSADDREQLRWSSRFPQGLTKEAMTALLQAAGQQQPDLLAALRP